MLLVKFKNTGVINNIHGSKFIYIKKLTLTCHSYHHRFAPHDIDQQYVIKFSGTKVPANKHTEFGRQGATFVDITLMG